MENLPRILNMQVIEVLTGMFEEIKPMPRKTTYGELEKTLINALSDLSMLSGDIPGPSDVSWQDIAGTAALNLGCLAHMLQEARHGNCEACISFPSPAECLEKV